MKGIYVHIPFCKQKCFYCDFVSFANCENSIDIYINAVKKEIKHTLKNTDQIDTIYIGGGTPSVIDSKYIKQILDEIYEIVGKDDTREITIEVNPGTLTEKKALAYKETGINRVSLGLQTTNDKLLKRIGRIHDFKQFLDSYNIIKKIGIENVNIDLMLGLPGQTINDLEESINQVINLNPKHISVYSLILEPGTKLKELIDINMLSLPSEEIEREMYWKTKNILEQNGYIHYEISNFAKENFESKHNCNCWKQQEYYGIGCAAHSYINNIRYSNADDLNEYITNVENGEYSKNKEINEIQTKETKMQEYMMLGLRTLKGIQVKEFKNKFQENPIYLYREKIEKLVNVELIEIDGDHIKLTNKGLDFANEVWEEFV